MLLVVAGFKCGYGYVISFFFFFFFFYLSQFCLKNSKENTFVFLHFCSFLGFDFDFFEAGLKEICFFLFFELKILFLNWFLNFSTVFKKSI